MTRFFGFLIAVAMSTGMANAALLATWNFNANADGVVETGVSATASAFTNFGTVDATAGNNGSISSQAWLSSSILKDSSLVSPDVDRGNVFTFTNTDPSKEFTLTSLSFNANTLTVPNTVLNVNSVEVTLFGRSNGTGAFVNLGNASVSPSTTALQTISFSKLVGLGDSYEFLMSYTGLALTTGFVQAPVQIRLDNIALSGSDAVVPEPASVACFAGLFAVGALRRLRKRA